MYHGSTVIIEKPQLGYGNPQNDYGLGFYTTPYPELAAEWACPKMGGTGYVNKYVLNENNLNILNMDKEPFEHWITTLVKCRGGRYSNVVQSRIKKFIEKYPFELKEYDLIMGWRANDSYFSFIRDFFSVGLSLENLITAMKFGELGVQYCLLTEKAFKQIIFICAEEIDNEKYFILRESRDREARNSYAAIKNPASGTVIFDIIGRD
jgi:hypothetical protein